jgi:hypothetical protein
MGSADTQRDLRYNRLVGRTADRGSTMVADNRQAGRLDTFDNPGLFILGTCWRSGYGKSCL